MNLKEKIQSNQSRLYVMTISVESNLITCVVLRCTSRKLSHSGSFKTVKQSVSRMPEFYISHASVKQTRIGGRRSVKQNCFTNAKKTNIF